MIGVIARRELRLLFATPLAWVLLAVVQFLCAWIFFTRVELFLENQARIASLPAAPGLTDIVVAPTLGSAAIILLLIAPLLTMRSFAEERRSATLALLRAAPTRTRDLVLGKYLALVAFFALQAALIALLPLSLLLGGRLDAGQLAAGLGGLLLVAGALAAIGLFTSSLTAHPAVAASAAAGIMLLLWIVGSAAEAGDTGLAAVLGYLSLLEHYQRLLRGLLGTADALYYLIVAALFLALAGWRLEVERLQA